MNRFFLVTIIFLSQLLVSANSTKVDSLNRVIHKTASDSVKCAAMVVLSSEVRKFNPDSAYKLLQSSLSTFQQSKQDKSGMPGIEGYILLNMASLEMFAKHDKEMARDHISIAIEEFLRIGDKKHLAGCYMIDGLIFHYDAQYRDALRMFDLSKLSYESARDTVGIAGVYNNMGLTYAKLGHLEKSIECYQQSVRLNESMGNELAAADGLNNIGTRYLDMNEPMSSIPYFRKAMMFRRDHGDKVMLAGSVNNMGVAYRSMNVPDSALAYFEKAIELYGDLDLPLRLVNAVNNVGIVYIDLGDFKKAQNYFDRAYDLAARGGDEVMISLILGNYAALANNRGQYEESIEYVERALPIIKKLNLYNQEIDVYETLIEVYSKTGDYKKALDYYRLRGELRDSLTSNENKSIVSRLEAEFQAEQRQAQIDRQRIELLKTEGEAKLQRIRFQALAVIFVLVLITLVLVYRAYWVKTTKNKELREMNEQILQQNEQIEEQAQKLSKINQGKDRLFSVVAHDLREPFASLQSVLESAESDEFSAEDASEVLKLLSANFAHTHGFLENLLVWSKSQLEGVSMKKERIQILALTRETIQLLDPFLIEKQLAIHVDIDEALSATVDQNMIHLVIRNLLSNAMKFSHRGSSINVKAKQDGVKPLFSKFRILELAMPAEKVTQLFTTEKNLHPEQRKKKGLALVCL
ncbi:MAG: tetratricopeptide repeat protein [Flavobacteriales bacterium]